MPGSLLPKALPRRLALVDDDPDYREYLADHLRGRGIAVDAYADSNDLLVQPAPHAYDFYVLDLTLPGVDGAELIRLLRRRSEAGLLVVSGRLGPEVFKDVMASGADMYLAKPVQFEQVVVAIEAIQRRAAAGSPPAAATAHWTYERQRRRLLAPDGAAIELSETDAALMDCFVAARGAVIPRDALLAGIGRTPAEDADGLNAIVYRLRRRIERATPLAAPLQAKSRVGYLFRAPLQEG